MISRVLASAFDLAASTAARMSARAAAQAQALDTRGQDVYDPVAKMALVHRELAAHAGALTLFATAVASRLGSYLARSGDSSKEAGEEVTMGVDLLLMSALFLMRPDFEKARKALSDNIAEILGRRAASGVVDALIESAVRLREYALRDLRAYGEPVIREAITGRGTPVLIETHPTYRLIRPRERRSALFVTIPHNGTELPPEAIFLRTLPARVAHSNADLWLHRVWEAVPDFGGTLMIARVGRYAADLNRTAAQATGKTVRGRAVKPGGTEVAEPIWSTDLFDHLLRLAPLTEREFETRMRRWHEPFVRRRLREIRAIQGEQGMVFLISAHNCPSRPARGHADWGIEKFRQSGRPLFNPGTTRRQIPIGDRHAGRIDEKDRTLPPGVRGIVEGYFRGAAVHHFPEFFRGLIPGTPEYDRRAFSWDSPYGGAAENWDVMDPSPESRRPGLQLEIPRELMFDEVTPAHPDGSLQPLPVMARLTGVITRFVEVVYPQIEAALRRHYGLENPEGV